MVNPSINPTFGNSLDVSLNTINKTIKEKMDTLINNITIKTSSIKSLEAIIKDDAVTIRNTINSSLDLRGKNIFIAQPIEIGDILDYLVPFGIQDSSLLNSGFKPSTSLSKTGIEAALYKAANVEKNRGINNVYLSMQSSMQSSDALDILTSNMGTSYADNINAKLYSSNTPLSTNLLVQNYNFYELDDTWEVNSNKNINFIGLGFNGMVYIGVLPTGELDSAYNAALPANQLNPNTLEPLILKYKNTGALPVNQILLDSLNSLKTTATNAISTYTQNIASSQDAIDIFQAEKQDEQAEIAQATAQIAQAKVREQQALSAIAQDKQASLDTGNWWKKMGDLWKESKEDWDRHVDAIDISKQQSDIKVYTDELQNATGGIALQRNAMAADSQSITTKKGDVTTLTTQITAVLNPAKVMKMQNYNTSTGPPNSNSNESQEFNAGYTRPISWMGCYRDGEPRAIKTQQENLNYKDCAAKAIEVGDNVFGLQFGGSSGDTPQCFTAKQTGPDYLAATMYPKSTSTIRGSTASSNVRPLEYTCVSDSNTPNVYYGGAWTNATYLVSKGYFSEITILGLPAPNTTSKYPPGTLMITIKTSSGSTGVLLSGFPTPLQTAPQNTAFINSTNLLPFSSGSLPQTSITSDATFNNFIGIDTNIRKTLFSPDFYFKLVLSGTGPGTVQINIKTDAAGANIAEKRTKFNQIQQFVQTHFSINPEKVLNSIYYLDLSVNNLSLGQLGFISYDDEATNALGTFSNPYKIHFYNDASSGILSSNIKQDSQFEFLKLKGTLSSPPTLTKPDNISDINACKQYCYGSVNKCTAWQYNELESSDNKCLITSQTNLHDILWSTAWSSAASGEESEFNIRMPTNQVVPTGCPPFNAANVVVARVPIKVNNTGGGAARYTTSVIHNGTASNFYYEMGSGQINSSSCNVKKVINIDMNSLAVLKTKRQAYVTELEDLLSKMNTAEQNIYTKLLKDQINLNTDIDKYNVLKTDLDYLNNNSDINMTMQAAVDDSMMQLIDNNYEYILWTILAIVIIIIAINLAKK